MRVKETEAGRALAIVGARACTSLGRLEAERFAFELSGCGIHIISGMAAGIDAAAHTGALKAGALTTAVLGSGVDVCYPVKTAGSTANCASMAVLCLNIRRVRRRLRGIFRDATVL